MNKWLSQIPITITAPIILILPVIVVAAVLISINTVQTKAASKLLVSANMGDAHDRIENHVIDLLAIPRRVTNFNASLIQRKQLDVGHISQWRPLLFDEFGSFPELSAVVWGGENGEAVWLARYAGEQAPVYAIKDNDTDGAIFEYRLDGTGEPAEVAHNSYAYQPQNRPWYATPANARSPVWSAPFVWVGGDSSKEPTLGIAYGQPVYTKENDLLGVIDAELSLDDLSDFLKSLEISEYGLVLVTDTEGLMIANSAGAAVARDGKMVAGRDAGEPRIETVALFHATNSLSEAEHKNHVLTIEDERWLLRTSHIDTGDGISWEIHTLVPESRFMSGVDAARRRAVAVTIPTVLVTIGLGVGLAWFAIQPFLVLEQQAKRVGEGDLTAELNLTSTPELRRLSVSFNQMVGGLRDRMAIRRSLQLAMEVQQSLLPAETPEIDGLEIEGHSTYCDETGGDYYDFLEITGLSEKSIGIVVGDVVGHGIAAAMLMATARGILQSRSRIPGSLADMLKHLNDLLVEVTDGGRFMTMLLLSYDADSRCLRWASAGHGPPLVYDPNQDDFLDLDGGGFPLGLFADAEYEEYKVRELSPGTILLASTDGLWESHDANDEDFGMERVHDQIRSLHEAGASAVSRGLHQTLQSFLGDVHQQDDITFVTMRVLAENEHRQPNSSQ